MEMALLPSRRVYQTLSATLVQARLARLLLFTAQGLNFFCREIQTGHYRRMVFCTLQPLTAIS
jgi:hypothetical protein